MSKANTLQQLGRLALPDALERVLTELGGDSGTVHALRSDGILHLEEYAGGIPEHLLPVIRRIPVGKGMAGLAAARGEPVQICNLQTDTSGDARPAARTTGMKGSICVPIWRDSQLVGVLGIAVAEEREFSAAETVWLGQAAAAIATAL